MKLNLCIVLIIGMITGILSIEGLLIGVGCFGLIALNIIWLLIYPEKQNKASFKHISKPSVYASIIGMYVVILLMTTVNYFVMRDDLDEMIMSFYGNTYFILGRIIGWVSLILFTLGTIWSFRIHQQRLNK